MKKLTVAVLCIVLAAATALPVFAAEHVVCRINEIETSFDISTKWDYVTRSHITESFARSRNMTVARVAEYLDDLGMYLWLYAEKGDYELEVNSAPDERGGAVIGVLDIDSPVLGRFTENDRAGLEAFARVIEETAEWREL